MKRRHLLAVPLLTLVGGAAIAADDDLVEYSPDAFAKALESGAPVMLDFYASW